MRIWRLTSPLLLEKGLDGLRSKVTSRRSRLQLTDWSDLHKEQFLKAIDISLAALSEHIERYAAVARQMAQEETRDWRRVELQKIAENCELIDQPPAKSHRKLLASPAIVLLIQLILQIESNGHSVSFGRLDQYLYPWYRRDVELEKHPQPRTSD
uniref:pyruvate formate lyase family protein n=1 Tax=Yersinia enterocolitica TaxID=630 RepID=UPI0022393D45|nr:pyruvate formate lyase family protein [Yersinia enterocolitica]